MNDSKKTQSTNPIFGPSAEFYGRGALTGLASFCFVLSITHFLQKPLRNRIKYHFAGSLFVSTSLAATATYFITKNYFEKHSKIETEHKAEN